MDTTLQLTDGRLLAYAQYGNARGKPVLFFHGMPGSRFFRPSDEITSRLGVRLITIDRPGYGCSSFSPGRRIRDWAEDVAELADALGIQSFAVAGHSGGGPYVAACAHDLGERVTRAAIVSGAGPVDAVRTYGQLSARSRLGLRFGRFLPWNVWRVLIWVLYRERAEDPARAQDRASGHRPPADEELIQVPLVRQACLLSEREAFRGGLRGLAWDARLLTRPWGFPLADIRVPVWLWHGTEDREAPLAMGEFVAKNIPGCTKILCPGEGHLLLFPHWEEILTTLTSA